MTDGDAPVRRKFRTIMGQNSFLDRLLRHTRFPEGFWGRFMLRGMNCGHAPLHRWGLSFLPWQASWRTLDIGCGGGAVLRRILELCPDGVACGVDPSPESVAFARRRNRRELGVRCFVEQGSADSLPCASEAFDAAVAFETVYFWKNLPRAFSEVARVLRPGGCFLIVCEAGDPEDPRWVKWTRRIGDMSVYSAATLTQHLSDAGFGNISVHRHPRGCLCIVARRTR